ncbi:fibroblast growth factor 8b-like isoform X2 [Nematostella vectensis]|nr:fibroblast growth factor 8b-like isoform X2 [Nematostella vectensis]
MIPWDRRHYKRQRDTIDEKSVLFTRTTTMYSRASGKHLRVLENGEVDGKGERNDIYAKVIVQSVTFGRITIRGIKSNRMLCLNKYGKLVGRKRKGALEKRKKCMFEDILLNGYQTFESVRYPCWFVAINKRGRAVKGHLSMRGKRTRFFMYGHLYRSLSSRSTPRRRRMKRLGLRTRKQNTEAMTINRGKSKIKRVI